MKSYAVIGLGRFGLRLAEQLEALGGEVLAIDSADAPVQEAADRVSRAVVANAANKETLRRLGVSDCDCAVVAIGGDIATSVLVTMNLKSLNVPSVICKASDEAHREVLLKLGADKVIIPEKEMADKLAKNLTTPNVLDYIELSDDCGIAEVEVPASWVGKTIQQVNIRAKYGVNVIAVKHGEKTTASLTAQYAFRRGEILVLLGDAASLKRIQSAEE